MNQDTPNHITIRDIDIPFRRLVVILLKVMLASIPAVIAFYAMIILCATIFLAIFGGGAVFLNNLFR